MPSDPDEFKEIQSTGNSVTDANAMRAFALVIEPRIIHVEADVIVLLLRSLRLVSGARYERDREGRGGERGRER